ncbi:nucleotidyl transferase AbiEii/AbiGii toxin family protein [Patescibacteria group bacterium]|nr:nucleotidyl transferase AbiEii/AbiGii toxin family protein [Patescibacteria group bacterium]MBU4141968.1 nucleotidyl transferase AbiEii/AbiGii toxin family protein [Patescibacteria group bacterium]
METIKIFLKDLLDKSESKNELFKRNILKEYLQVLVLEFIYSHPAYSNLFFYGGSCLAHCYGLPRMSEDLDFIDANKEIKILELASDIKSYFKKNTDLEIKTAARKFRIYLKFPVLRELGLAGKSESDLLFLKVEIFSGFDFCEKYKAELIPLFKFNKPVLIKTFDLPTLMSTKIMAVLERKWEKKDKSGKILAKVKGRDYFDLMWYLEKNINPNMDCLKGVKDKKELKEKLAAAVRKADSKSIAYDLESFIGKKDFVENLSKNIKDIIKRGLEKL